MLPPPWPETGWPKIRITGATRLDPEGTARRFAVQVWLENGARPVLLLTACPYAGAQLEIPPEWPDPAQWSAELLSTIRRTWPLLLAGTPPLPAESTLPSLRRKPGRPRNY